MRTATSQMPPSFRGWKFFMLGDSACSSSPARTSDCLGQTVIFTHTQLHDSSQGIKSRLLTHYGPGNDRCDGQVRAEVQCWLPPRLLQQPACWRSHRHWLSNWQLTLICPSPEQRVQQNLSSAEAGTHMYCGQRAAAETADTNMQRAIKLLRCARQFQPDTGANIHDRKLRKPSAMHGESQHSLRVVMTRCAWTTLVLQQLLVSGEAGSTPARFAVRSLLGFLFIAR